MKNGYTRRWRGRSKEQVSAAMRALALKRVRGMSAGQLRAHVGAMVEARGPRWVIGPDGKRKYAKV